MAKGTCPPSPSRALCSRTACIARRVRVSGTLQLQPTSPALLGDELDWPAAATCVARPPQHVTPRSDGAATQLKVQRAVAMGKVAKCLGIGIKGSIRVMLHRESYAAGDVVQGQLVLRVSRPIECEAFSMHVEGAETVAWSEGANHALSSCNMRDEFLCERVELVEPMPSAFEPGGYRFRFRYQLDDTLPPVFRVTGGFAGAMREVNASVSYTIKARLVVQGKMVADLETSHDLAVHRPSLCHPVRSLHKSSSDEVRLLSLMKSRGACEVSTRLDSDVHISGSTLSLQARISNYSSRDMHSISALLYEDLTVELPNRRQSKGTRLVCSQNFPGVAAGQLLDEMLYLPLLDDVSGRPIAPTNSAAFVRWQYRLEIKCRFTLSKSVKVEMPVVILRNVGAPPALGGGAMSPPAMVVVVPGENGEGDAEQQGGMAWSPSQVYAETEGDSVVARPTFILPQAVAAV
ncbi:hypothetical protein PHYPSEUDO_003380 [Phytophthora pseudosyringae]|uniref:Arrestin C-terminal-like domain-containing protein n=1 Tax=Phytophthora pseudosyringae TaxID=221518 RepID=A0A8T1VRD1_9STRA|nr:hypothetical protein PHYPSEUDO_003380 [Phytophthora pseudosyringae]